ncbi:MAG: hypothetical protein BLM47_00860 [Candidatus Reconcilbacillus cellulovorans]|uniref:Chorismate dehydratase n=1 Tax=Candidatus Reconcilbacillus cellulovorans TaxID=1906605 RepID=A0A2A6E4K4_9BACL|nr:MAG: hypothetical protein BLM47_00860 [Candidatus Reconcilbacillus cellulovorans]
MRREPLRIGKIGYANVWPLFWHFNPHSVGVPVEIVEKVPAELNADLAAGRIDMAMISSWAYARDFDRYFLFPDLSISAFGRVRSVLLFHRKPLEEVARGTVALTTSSATSVHLLDLLLVRLYGGRPAYVTLEPHLDDMLRRADAALLIGDDAIRAAWSARGCEITDLAERWTAWTGRWMTFAVWAVREETARERPEEVETVFRALQESKRKGNSDRGLIVRCACETFGGDERFWREYFDGLCYEFSENQQEGLSYFYRSASELGLLPADIPLRMWNASERASAGRRVKPCG